MKVVLNKLVPLCAIFAGSCFLLTAADANLRVVGVPRRIKDEIKSGPAFRLKGNTRPMLSTAHDEGELSGTQDLSHITLNFRMTSQQQEDLDQLLRQQQSPDSEHFHQFLSPEEFGARFGPNPEDISKVVAWLESQGFSNLEVARSRTFISFDGLVSQAQTAFQTTLHRYTLNGESHFANATDPLLPKALEGMVESVRGLHDFRMKPRGVRMLDPRFTSSISGRHFLTPDDFATIYNLQPLYQAGLDGTGVKIAIAGQSDVQLSDIRAFRSAAGLSPNDPVVVVTGPDPGTRSGDETESDLDIEWAGGIARNATIVFVTSRNVNTSISYAIDNNVAPILSLSYGSCEAELSAAESSTDAMQYRQANAQGMTIIAAAGDSGAADCDSSAPVRHGLSADNPASLPYVTGIGGTTLTEGAGAYWNSANNSYNGSALSYIPETAWNDASSTGTLSAGGGGVSIYNLKPVWQTGLGVPSDGMRDVPDLAFAASPNLNGYLICTAGSCTNGFRDANTNLKVVGGTSAGSPSFAGIVALLVQSRGAQGNINPNLYALAASSTDAFHDIVSGNNIVTCSVGTANCASGTLGYSAGVGYDQVTGLGSVNAYNLISQWANRVPALSSASQGPLRFIPLTPCRIVDTRSTDGAFGGPALPALSVREFDLPASTCNIPATAVAYALNVTVVPTGPLTYLSIWPSGQGRPTVSTLNSDGRIKANAAVVPAGTNGGINVYVTNPTHLVMDISGYFVPSSSSSGLQFFPLTPCRVADTRNAAGSVAGAPLTGGQSRDFAVLSSGCNVPANAQAYSLNFTVIPREPLVYLTVWPTGQAQPPTSILNAPTGTVTANAAIVPASSDGSITAYSSNTTNVVIDINGYFAPPATSGLNFFTLTPCRVLDTRNPAGSLPFTGTLPVNVTTSGCQSPATAQAYALNATVVPSGPLQYLTLWPDNQNIPATSTLNADPNVVTSNLAILTTTGGSVNAYAAGSTHLILDISGYFAP